jgi:hypothetical protein
MYPKWWYYYFPFGLIIDIYWCFIPYHCRECMLLYSCRSSFWKGRKCYKGCIAYKEVARKTHEADREDYLDNLVKYVEEQEQKQKRPQPPKTN